MVERYYFQSMGIPACQKWLLQAKFINSGYFAWRTTVYSSPTEMPALSSTIWSALSSAFA